MRLEPELWDALREICQRERQDISRLVRQIEATGHSGGRTSAVRVFVLEYFRAAASEAGHEAVDHWQLDRGRQGYARTRLAAGLAGRPRGRLSSARYRDRGQRRCTTGLSVP